MADSYNEIFGLGSHSEDASLEGWWLLGDDAASTAVDDQSSNANDGTLEGGDNTSDVSTTSPTSWLPGAFAFDGTADNVNLGNFFEPGTGDYTWLCRSKSSSTADQEMVRRDPSVATRYITILRMDSQSGGGTARFYQLGGSGTVDLVHAGGYDDGAWHTYAGTRLSSSSYLYVDGAQRASGGDPGTLDGANDDWAIGAWRRSTSVSGYWVGDIGETVALSRGITVAEFNEWEDGPEPVNTVAPVLSGPEEIGQTLSVTSGTWALDAPFSSGTNGTITYSYQWTRSNDAGGTGEVDIGGATSSSYTPVVADETKHLRCRVRASNDGGYDSAADTNSNMSGAITGGGVSVPVFSHHYRQLARV